MKSSPAFQFYPADFLASTAAMTATEVGVYIRLLAWSWVNGPLPLSDVGVRQVAAYMPSDWPEVWAAVASRWQHTPSGWINCRLEKTRAEQEEYRLKQIENGRKGGRPKTQTEPKDNPTLNPVVNPELTQRLTQELTQTEPKQNPSVLRSSPLISDLGSTTSATSGAQTAPVAYVGKPTHPRQRYAPSIISSQKAHQSHGYCLPNLPCVPPYVHDDLMKSISGDQATRFDRLTAWYRKIDEECGGEVFDQKPDKFWAEKFRRDFKAGTAKADAAHQAELDRTAKLVAERSKLLFGPKPTTTESAS